MPKPEYLPEAITPHPSISDKYVCMCIVKPDRTFATLKNEICFNNAYYKVELLTSTCPIYRVP